MHQTPKSIIASLAFFCLTTALSHSATLASVTCEQSCSAGAEANQPVCKWTDTVQEPRGIVLMVHGITQNAGSLSVLSNLLANNGFIVYGIDQRGHGWWHYENAKGKGYHCDFKQSVKDVDQILTVIKNENPNLPMFIVGESAGAGVALRSAAAAPELVNGLVLVAAGYKAGKAKISWVAGDVAKNFYRPNHQINITRYQRKYGTEDLASLEESLKDPRQRPTMSLRELLGTVLFVRGNRKYARRLDPNCSVFVVQGEKDRVLTAKSARRVFASIPCSNKEMLVVPNCGHIVIGTNHVKPIVSQSITAWLLRNSVPGQIASTVKGKTEPALASVPARKQQPKQQPDQLVTPELTLTQRTNQVASATEAIVH